MPDTGVKRRHFSWVTAPRPWGTSSCADLKDAVLQHGCFIGNPAQPSPEHGLPGAQGQWHKWIPSPPLLKQCWKCSVRICPTGEEKMRLLWGERVTRKLCRGSIRVTEPHTCGQEGWSKPHGMEQIGQDWSPEALAELDQWLSTTGLLQQGTRSPLLILSVSCWPPVRMSGKDELGQQHLGWTQIRLYCKNPAPSSYILHSLFMETNTTSSHFHTTNYFHVFCESTRGEFLCLLTP